MEKTEGLMREVSEIIHMDARPYLRRLNLRDVRG